MVAFVSVIMITLYPSQCRVLLSQGECPTLNVFMDQDETAMNMKIWLLWTTSGGCIECPEYNRTPANTALTRKLPQLTCNQSRWPCIFSQQQVGIPVTWWDPVPRVKPLSDTRTLCQWTAIQYSMFTINSHAHGHVNEISPCGCTIFSFISRMFINNYFFIMFNLTPRVND